MTTPVAAYARAAYTLSRLLADARSDTSRTTSASRRAAIIRAGQEASDAAALCPDGIPPGRYVRCAVCHVACHKHAPADDHDFVHGPNGRRPDPSTTPDAMLISRAMATGRYRTREHLAADVAARCPAGVPLTRAGKRREGKAMTAGAARRAMSRACVRPGVLDEHWDLPAVMRAALEAIAAGAAEQSTDG